MKKVVGILALLIMMIIVISGCGGNETKSTSLPTTITLYSEGALDGSVSKTQISPPNYSINTTYTYFATGSEITGGSPQYQVSVRGYISFDISGIPSGATIQNAVLKVFREPGNSPAGAYTILGNLMLDHVVYPKFDNASADTLYNLTPLDTLATPFSISATGSSQCVVTTQVQSDMANDRSHSQFRFRFTKEFRDDPDVLENHYELWGSGESTNNKKPVLEIIYVN